MHTESLLTQTLNAIGLDANAGLRRRFNDHIRMSRAVRDARRVRPQPSFAQCAEDVMLLTLVGEAPGTYVDIGSGHPIRGSNTYALYQRGWSGLLVDPLPVNIELSRRLRPRDTALAALCGKRELDAVEFFEYDVYEYSTASPERVDELASRGHSFAKTHSLAVRSLSTLLDQFDLGQASVLSIDVEGLELDVLQGNNWHSFSPPFIVVEEWYPPVPKPTEVYEYLIDHGYTLVAFNRASTIYQRVGQ